MRIRSTIQTATRGLYIGLYRIAKVLLGIAIFLAIFSYDWKIVIPFLLAALLILSLYLSISLVILKNNDYKLLDLNQQVIADADIIRLNSHKKSDTFETYLIFDINNKTIFESKNITSIINTSANHFTVILSKAVTKPYYLETIGIEPDQIKILPAQFRIRFKQPVQGLVVVRILSSKS
jgi:hypothetical protein